MKTMIIAIDGPAASGKSTTAKNVAKELGFAYLDTGAMYRAVTLFAMQKGYISKDYFNKDQLVSDLKNIDLHFIFNQDIGFAEIHLNGVNVEKEVRTLEVSNFVSKIAAVSEIRKKLVEQQQIMGKNKGLVMDGRDIGSVVFPDAELKIFLTANPQIRAERRLLELKEKGFEGDFEAIVKNVVERDRIDSTRADSPLIKVVDAVEIDVSNIDKEEEFQQVLNLAKKKLDN